MIKVPAHLEAVIEAGGTWVAPTRRRAHALRLAHAAAQLGRGRRVWASPDVLPLEGWLGRECERAALQGEPGMLPARLLRPSEEWLLWRECTAEAIGGLALANPGALAEGLLTASRLAGQIGLDLARVRAAAHTETALLLEVERSVAERTRRLGARGLSEALSTAGALGDERPVALCGFLLGDARLGAVRAARAARGWPTLWEAPEVAQATPEVLFAADETEELDRIAGWCREQLREAPEARLLVVLPGSSERCARLAALIRQALDGPGAYGAGASGIAAVEGGEALSHQPAVAYALTALALLAGGNLTLEALLEWLRGPFWCEPAEERARLDVWLREHAPPALERAGLERLLGAAPRSSAGAIQARLATAASALGAAVLSPREWSERFQAALDALGWPGAQGLDSPAQQTLLRLRELLDEYGQLSAAATRFERRTALERLRELAERTAYRPAEQDAAVTVSASLSDPVVRYEGIWVAGLHHDTLPQAPDPNSFLPLTAQLGAQWPAASASGRLREAQALLGAWRAATDRLVLSAPRRAGDLALLPSPLLAPWAPAPAPRGPALAWLPERVHRDDQLEPWHEVVLPWERSVALPSGTRSLELQNLCPFRAYGELRLGCTPLGTSEPGVPADLRGRLLHLALQELWRELGDSDALGALNASRLDERIGECVERAERALLAELSAPPSGAALRRERRRAVRLVHALCELERGRAPFRVRDTERATELTVGGARLNLRIDRIDALADGSLAILDYKSGRPVRADWYGERPSHPQLLAYLAAVGAGVRALATVHLTAREITFRGIAAQADLLPGVQPVEALAGAEASWPAQCAAWQAVLDRLAAAFAAGEAAVDPKPGACTFCHLGTLCRVGERLESSEDEPGEGP